MAYRVYDDEFKLHVVTEYFNSNLGVRLIARLFNLPNKNYLTRWIAEMKSKGLISTDIKKQPLEKKIVDHKLKPAEPTTEGQPTLTKAKTPLEIHLEKENLRLRAQVDFLKKLSAIVRGDS